MFSGVMCVKGMDGSDAMSSATGVNRDPCVVNGEGA